MSSAHPDADGSANHQASPLTFALLLLVWWGCNNLFAVHAHRLLADHARVPYLFVDVSLAQVALGLCLGSLFTRLTAADADADSAAAPAPAAKPTRDPHASALLAGAAVLHAAATQLTNASYALIGGTSTLVWKLTEPLFAAALRRIVLGQRCRALSLAGVALVLLGALLFSAQELSLRFSPVVLANVLLPLRNVALKRRQSAASANNAVAAATATAAARTYVQLSARALPLCVAAALLKRAALGSASLPPPQPLLLNALLFNAYQLASLALLARMDVLTHSLANTLKRLSGVAVAAVATSEPLTPLRAVALLLAAVGFPLHVAASRNALRARLPLALLALLLTAAAVLALAMALAGASPWLAPAVARTEQAPSSSFVISQAGYYIYTEDTYHSEREALTFPDTNNGNMVWQYGGYRRLVDFSNSVTCNDTHVNCNRADASMRRRCMVHYRPAANGFNSKMNLSFSDAYERLEYEHDVILYVGIGMQYAFKDDSSKDDMFDGQRIENSVHTFRFPHPSLKFLYTMNQLRIPMFMRGDFTLNASRLAGYQYGVSAGCPSLFINRNLQLGALLEHKYRRIINARGKKRFKIAFNLTGRHRMFKWMKSIADLHPGSLFYPQGPEDFRVLRNHNVSFEQVRFFGNVDDWMESLSHMDLSIGPRIHGNMAAIAAGVPAFVVAPDFRVLEMVQRMHIPHTTMYDDGLEKGMDVGEMLSKAAFDGSAFDANRCQIAKVYREHFARFGLHLSQHVQQLSQLC